MPLKGSGYRKIDRMFLKRITDVAISLAVLACAGVGLLLIAAWIKLDSEGPALFKQKRVGIDGEFFEIYKFRTMRIGTPNVSTEEMLKLPSPVTKAGYWLRKFSLDELPQLFNVLKGEMSLVGPRPALYNQTELTDKRQAVGVLKFPPGITGWAQINGRDELPDDVKVEADKWYCDHWSYLLDWKIIFATFGAVLSKRGAF